MAEKGPVKFKVDFNCGCGYKCHKQGEAEAHVEKTGHSMFILGEVKLRNKKPKGKDEP